MNLASVAVLFVALYLIIQLSPAQSSDRRPTVHLLSGMPASGKSTIAQHLKRKYNAFVFSADEWMLSLYGTDFPVERFQDHGDVVKQTIWSVASSLIRDHDMDVVLDFSLWSRAERDLFRAKAIEAGARVQLYRVHCPDDVSVRRLAQRNTGRNTKTTFYVSPDTFLAWRQYYEEPTPDEDADFLIIDTDNDRVLHGVTGALVCDLFEGYGVRDGGCPAPTAANRFGEMETSPQMQPLTDTAVVQSGHPDL